LKAVYLQKHTEIKTLCDLGNPAKLEALGRHLLKVFGEVIIYEGSIKEKSLPPGERVKLEQFKNPLFWSKLKYQKRYEKRLQFEAMLQKHGAERLKRCVLFAISEKVKKLCFVPQLGGDDFTDFGGKNANPGGVMISPLEYRVKSYPLEKEKTPTCVPEKNGKVHVSENGPKGGVSLRIFCGCCGRDISAQKPGSKFCSELLFGKVARRCRDKVNKQERTAKRRAERERENGTLAMLATCTQLERIKFTYRTWEGEQTATIEAAALLSVQRVFKVEGSAYKVAFVLTTRRAKEFLKMCKERERRRSPVIDPDGLDPTGSPAARPSPGGASTPATPTGDGFERWPCHPDGFDTLKIQ
jgi:hypothetical protein